MATSCTSATEQIVFHFIMADRHIIFDKLQRESGLGRAALHNIIHKDLKMKKVCVHGVPPDLMQLQKQTRGDICHQLLALHYQDAKNFFTRLVTGYDFQLPKKKRQSMQWKDPGIP
jgi:hypothetical protein